MDEPKPDHSQGQDPVEESEDGDGGLVSKLARAQSTLPPEQRWASSLGPNSEQLSNPELEEWFQVLLKQQEVLATSQGQHQEPDPATIALLEKQIEQMQARSEGLSENSSASTTEKEVVLSSSGNRQCSKCGQANPASSRFCGMCGAEMTKQSNVIKQEPTAGPGVISGLQKPDAPLSSFARTIDGRFHRTFRIGFFVVLFAILALLAFGQWSLWRQQRLQRARPANAVPPTAVLEATAPSAKQPTPNPPGVVNPPQAAPVADRPGTAARKIQRRSTPPVIVKQPLPAPLPAPAQLASEAEVPPEQPIIVPPATPPILKASEAPAPAHETPSPPRISQVTPGALIYKINPEYPATARNARVQGAVVMRAVIGTDGTIQQLEVIKGNPLLVNAAMQAAKKWRFRPALLDGKPVEIETTITISFKGE